MSGEELFEVRVETRVRARHRRGPAGEEAEEHDHLWHVTVRARSRHLDAIAIVVDFRRLLQDADAMLDEIRDRCIETHPDFARRLTTAAGVAGWVLERLRRTYRAESYRVVGVEVTSDPGISYTAGSGHEEDAEEPG